MTLRAVINQLKNHILELCDSQVSEAVSKYFDFQNQFSTKKIIFYWELDEWVEIMRNYEFECF